MIAMCAQTKTRSSTFVTPSSPNRFESAFETGDELAGHSFSPSAIREACQSSSVVTMPAISARIRSASPRWLPSKRAGRWTLRMITAPITPASTITANTSTMNANQPWWPSHGSVASRLTAPIIAITIVGKRTRKPQKIAAWIRPGTSRWRQLPLAEHDHRLVLDPLRHVVEAIDRLAEPDEIDEQLCPSRKQRAADGEERGERDSAERDVYGTRAFRALR
jgi:hypothetical protein